MDRKIVERLIEGKGFNALVEEFHVSKRRLRALRARAWEYGYLAETGGAGVAKMPPYPESLFTDSVDGRELRTSESHDRLLPHLGWMQERLTAGWHAVTVYEEYSIRTRERNLRARHLRGGYWRRGCRSAWMGVGEYSTTSLLNDCGGR